MSTMKHGNQLFRQTYRVTMTDKFPRKERIQQAIDSAEWAAHINAMNDLHDCVINGTWAVWPGRTRKASDPVLVSGSLVSLVTKVFPARYNPETDSYEGSIVLHAVVRVTGDAE